MALSTAFFASHLPCRSRVAHFVVRSLPPGPLFSLSFLRHGALLSGLGSSRERSILLASINSSSSGSSMTSDQEADSIPLPVIVIDQDSDSDAEAKRVKQVCNSTKLFFVEKLLRLDVHRLFLLFRAGANESASYRLHKDVIGKELFDVLRNEHGQAFDSFILEKVTPVAGDIAYEDLGIEDCRLKEGIWRESDVIVNVAANTKFDERYDVALSINAFGAKQVLEFAKKCVKLELLLHVSTAYVAGEKEGLILEKQLSMGETLNGSSNLNIDYEAKVVEEKLKEMRAHEVSEKVERLAMKELGMKRARTFGWPNTYVFTKAMGEMLLGQMREKIPLVILRPTIITSTYREPFPDWIEGTRTMDALIVNYGKGKLKCVLGHPESIVDLIPGDMVVNAMLATMVVHLNQPSQYVYHIGSSVRNPVRHSLLQECSFKYFSSNPCMSKDRKPVRVSRVVVFDNMASCRRYMNLHYRLPLEGLRIANVAFGQILQGVYSDLSRKYNSIMRLLDLYEPYFFFNGRFDDANVERLRLDTKDGDEEGRTLGFDPKSIDWEEYFMHIHIPGLIKYPCK